MTRTDLHAPSSRAGSSALERAGSLVPLALWALGMVVVFLPVIVGPLGHVSASLGDPRLVNFTLEHGYRWLAGWPQHRELWSPPIFYPHPNVGAYTDVLLGIGPFYWPWRMAGLKPDTAFQLWMLAVWSANYLAAFLLLRRFLAVGVAGSSLGAYLFAFANPRLAQFGHPQLVPHLWVLLAVIALLAVFRERSGTGAVRRQRLWVAAFLAAVVLQAWSAVYLFAFLVMVLGAALLWSLALPRPRRELAAVLRRQAPFLLAALVLAGAALTPLALHYTEAARELGVPPLNRDSIPRWASWLVTGQRNLLYGWLQRLEAFATVQGVQHSGGVGFVTLAAALVGLWHERRRSAVLILALATATVMAAVTMFGGFSLWQVVHDLVPGAGAIRAIGRIGLILVLPAALGLAFTADRLARRRRFALLALLAFASMSEQIQSLSWVEKAQLRGHVERLAQRVGPECEAFLLACAGPERCDWVHDDAAWVTLESGVPTVNGRYGNFPPGYKLQRPTVETPLHQRRTRRQLGEWLAVHGLRDSVVCWIEYPGIPRKDRVVTWRKPRLLRRLGSAGGRADRGGRVEP